MLNLLSLFAALTLGFPEEQPYEEAQVRAHVHSVAEGDADAGAALYRATVVPIFRAVRPLCRSEQEAEDVVQETYAKALEAIGRYREEPRARFLSWLMTIALNVARKRVRLRRREVVSTEVATSRTDEMGSHDADAGEQIDRARGAKALLTALDELPERQREIVTLRYGAELSAKEVAEACDLTESNVRKVCERQRKVLAARIESLLGETGETT